MENKKHNGVLTVQLESDQIVIRLPFDALQCAAEACPDLEEIDDDGEFAPPIVTDLPKFAAAVVCALSHEEEDGTTPVHRMFDAAFVSAIEAGGDGVEIFGVDGYEKAKAARAKNGTAVPAWEADHVP